MLERTDRKYCGHVDEHAGKYLFYPADGRFPNFTLNSSRALLSKKIMVGFVDWPDWSEWPRCRLIKVLGDSDDMFVEGNVILLEHQVEIKDFSKAVLACLPTQGVQIKINVG